MERSPAPTFLVVDPKWVPKEFAARGRPVVLISLTHSESKSLLSAFERGVDESTEELLRMIVDGLPQGAIARRLGVSLRTVQRRLALARAEFGVSSTSELATALVRGGLA